jgi:iron complex transport system substrate-binding protein
MTRFVVVSVLVLGCGRSPDVAPPAVESVDVVKLHFAKGFRIEKRGPIRIVTVANAWKAAGMEQRYVLVPKGEKVPSEFAESQIVRTPVEEFAALSTTHLSAFNDLGRLDALVGFSALKYVNNSKVREGFSSGRITAVGTGGSSSIERIAALGCEALFASDFASDAPDHADALRRLGVQVVFAADFAEDHPLGRAEWIRFFAPFFNEEAKAERLFDAQMKEYQRLAALTAGMKQRPTVLLNAPFKGNWHVPGGKSHAARLLADAGAQYLWADVDSAESLPLQFEAVLAKAADADYWLNPGQWSSLAQAKAEDRSYELFAPFLRGMVFNCDLRKSPDGGTDYWETGVNHPERALADLIAIFHPELLPDHRMNWYRKLP